MEKYDVVNEEERDYSTEIKDSKDVLADALEYDINCALRRLEELKGEIYVKEFIRSLPLSF